MAKIVKLVSIFLICCFCYTPVFASPSVENNGLVDQNKIYIEDKQVNPNEIGCYFFDSFEEEHVEAHIISMIEDINKNKELLKELIDVSHNQSDFHLGEYKMLTDIKDLSFYDKVNNTIIPHKQKVTVTWEVPLISDNTNHIKILHYSTERKIWEILEPIEVNYENKTITQYFEDLSPVTVLYIPKSNNSESIQQSTSTQTSDSTHVIEYTILAFLSLTILCVSYKMKNSN